MQFSIPAVTNSSEETQDANNYPLIRLFTVGQGTSSRTPLMDLQTIEQVWSISSNTSINNKNGFGYFSAVCYLFGRDVFNGLGGTVSRALQHAHPRASLPVLTLQPPGSDGACVFELGGDSRGALGGSACI
jgi:hypothetical protein